MMTRERVGELLEAVRPGGWRWYHGALFYAVVQALGYSLGGLVSLAARGRASAPWESRAEDRAYFKSLRQAAFAPPSWAFGPAWTINNLSVIWGTLRLLNMPPGTDGRPTYLALQAASWLEFALFSAAYFGLRSPINALVLTVGYLALTVASGAVALLRVRDSKLALSLATLFVWLIVATASAACQVLWNRDALYKVGPFAEPPRGWSRPAGR